MRNLLYRDIVGIIIMKIVIEMFGEQTVTEYPPSSFKQNLDTRGIGSGLG